MTKVAPAEVLGLLASHETTGNVQGEGVKVETEAEMIVEDRLDQDGRAMEAPYPRTYSAMSWAASPS